ncbi:MAG: efflux RND transporter periplasmic adaptor subunit, partial [Lysobacterales bacterium]
GSAPPKVTVAKPLLRQVTDWDKFTGRLAAVNSVDIRARVSGYLETLKFKEGSIVDKGDLLFVIDPRPYEAVLSQAQAALTQEKARLQLASNELKRVQKLYGSSAVSEEALDTRTQAHLASLAAVEAAQAQVVAAQLNVEFTHIKAPIRGRISRAIVTEGNLVSGGNEGATLLTTIVSLDPIHFYFTGNERAYLRYLRLDQAGSRPSSHNSPNPVRLRLADETEFEHEGHMDFLDNRIDAATGTVQGRAIFPNPADILVPGMFAEIQLLGEGPYEALLIPDEAIGFDQSQQFVFVLDVDNEVQRKEVILGRMEQGLRIVRSGLGKDDRVIITGIQRVRTGVAAEPELVDLNQFRESAGRADAP